MSWALSLSLAIVDEEARLVVLFSVALTQLMSGFRGRASGRSAPCLALPWPPSRPNRIDCWGREMGITPGPGLTTGSDYHPDAPRALQGASGDSLEGLWGRVSVMSRDHNTGNSESHPDVLFWLAEIVMSHGQTVLRFFFPGLFFSSPSFQRRS